ncbi:unnamed protein product [Ilex paraguariensis]|uniref:Uncharacterized protein n=1 Tax=Ilex paraguariensis TaxID=185542 RepID=A0ABC8SBP7_9AQUA
MGKMGLIIPKGKEGRGWKECRSFLDEFLLSQGRRIHQANRVLWLQTETKNGDSLVQKQEAVKTPMFDEVILRDKERWKKAVVCNGENVTNSWH